MTDPNLHLDTQAAVQFGPWNGSWLTDSGTYRFKEQADHTLRLWKWDGKRWRPRKCAPLNLVKWLGEYGIGESEARWFENRLLEEERQDPQHPFGVEPAEGETDARIIKPRDLVRALCDSVRRIGRDNV